MTFFPRETSNIVRAHNLLRLIGVGLASGALAAGCATVDDDFHEAVDSARAPLLSVENAVEGEYIVVFEDEIGAAGVSAAMNRISLRSPESRVLRTFEVLPAFVARLSPADLARVRQSPDVAYVEANGLVSIHEGERGQIAPSKIEPVQADGIDRIDQRDLPRDGLYDDHGFDGSGVRIYIITTGIRSTHDELTGRIGGLADFVGDGRNGEDCNGHGTHIASTAAGAQHGVADGATIHGVRVLNCQGSGSIAGVIAGMNFVAQDCAANGGPCVASLALGGGFSSALNQAVASAVASGVPVVVPAGHGGVDACTQSPASEPSAITVPAANDDDTPASFNNFGTCVDSVFAPGQTILGAHIGSDSATAIFTGTASASAHMAGVAAQYLQANPGATPAQVQAAIEGAATAVPAGILLLFNDVNGAGPPPADSCEGRCGNFDPAKSCQCDRGCVQFGDCCDDFDQLCPPEADPSSCVENNACGGQAPAGCFCDNLCVELGDCCPDGPC